LAPAYDASVASAASEDTPGVGNWARLPSVGRLEAAWGVRFSCPPHDRPT